MNAKAIFFDIDGTLISFRTHQLPLTTKNALIELRKKDIKLFIATGRSPSQMKSIEEVLEFDFDGYVTMNGQYCFNKNKVIHEQCIPVEDLAHILPYIKDKKIACNFVELDYIYTNIINNKVLEFRKLLGDTISYDPIDNIERIFENKTYQISPFIYEDDEQEFLENLPNCKSARWHRIFTDIIPKTGGKAIGIQKVLDYYDIELADSMAFGDGGNDIEMLEYVNIGIAMGNANDNVKKIADYITTDVDEGGILSALKHFNIL